MPTWVAAKPTPSGSLKLRASFSISLRVCKRAGVIFLTALVSPRKIGFGAFTMSITWKLYQEEAYFYKLY